MCHRVKNYLLHEPVLLSKVLEGEAHDELCLDAMLADVHLQVQNLSQAPPFNHIGRRSR